MFFYVQTYLFFQLVWIRVNRMLSQPTWLTHARTESFHKIVVIGDGFAEGLGDYVMLGNIAGVTRRLTSLIKRDATVKQQWVVLNWGQSGTTSSDWLPDQPLFKNTFSLNAFKDVEIVMLWVGANDGRPGPKHQFPSGTVKNIKAISDALRKEGKRVIIAGLPCTGPAKIIEEEEQWNKEANKLLREYVETETKSILEKEEKGLSSSDAPLAYGPNLAGPKFTRDFTLGFDEVHFNSEGYKIAAKDTYDVLHKHMKAIEWATFSKRLGFTSSGQQSNEKKKDK